jgi:hypothetical protein
MAKSTSWSVVGLAFVFTGVVNIGACGSDEDPVAAPQDSGTDRSSGGRGGSGSGGSSGTSGTGGAPDAGTCTTAAGTTCDGPEDCPTGQRCCGKWENEVYVEFGCFVSCAAQQGDAATGPGGGPFWFDLCHPGGTCEDTTATCLTSTYLPDSLSRCFDTGEPPDPSLGNAANQVNCGTDVCGAGEKCCVRQPLEPYCAPASATCSCTAPVPDAGPDAPPDSGDAAPDSGDAAPDSGDAASDATTGG